MRNNSIPLPSAPAFSDATGSVRSISLPACGLIAGARAVEGLLAAGSGLSGSAAAGNPARAVERLCASYSSSSSSSADRPGTASVMLPEKPPKLLVVLSWRQGTSESCEQRTRMA